MYTSRKCLDGFKQSDREATLFKRKAGLVFLNAECVLVDNLRFGHGRLGGCHLSALAVHVEGTEAVAGRLPDLVLAIADARPRLDLGALAPIPVRQVKALTWEVGKHIVTSKCPTRRRRARQPAHLCL